MGGGSGGAGHRDCNGKTPGPHTRLMSEVFPQVNARKDRADLDEETDYVSPEAKGFTWEMVEIRRGDQEPPRGEWEGRSNSPGTSGKFLLT